MYIHETTHSQSTSLFSTSETKPRCFTKKNTRRIFSHFSRHIFFSLLENDESERDTIIISDSSFVLSRVVVFCEHSLVVVENEREEQTVCVVFEEKGERVKRKCFEAKARR
tara:strand:- start:1630 stop:1962 length:333 start_codon:yes stop_codon:yes gene_type:complete